MIKIKLSYTDPDEKSRVLEILKTIRITRISHEYQKSNHKVTYIEAEMD